MAQATPRSIWGSAQLIIEPSPYRRAHTPHTRRNLKPHSAAHNTTHTHIQSSLTQQLRAVCVRLPSNRTAVIFEDKTAVHSHTGAGTHLPTWIITHHTHTRHHNMWGVGRGARDGIVRTPSRTRAPKPDSRDGEHLQGREQAVAAAAPILIILVIVEAAGRPRLVIKDVHLGVFFFFFAVLVVVVVVICRAGAGVSGPSGAPSSQLRLQPTRVNQCRFKPSTPGRACRACGEGWVGGVGVRVGGAHRGARLSPRGPPRRRWPAAPMARSDCCLRHALTHLPSRLGSGGPDAVHLRRGTCLVGWLGSCGARVGNVPCRRAMRRARFMPLLQRE